MSDNLPMRGQAPGGGGKFKNRPDTLRSNDTFEAVIALGGNGPWQGLTQGLKSVYVDDTQLEDADGTPNFKDFNVAFRNGDPLAHPQIVGLKLSNGGASSTTAVGATIGNDNPSAPGPWTTRTVPGFGHGYIDLRFIVSALYRQTKKGIFETTARLEIELKPVSSATWSNPLFSDPDHAYSESGQVMDDGFGGTLQLLIQRSYYNAGGAWIPDPEAGYLVIDGKTTQPYVKEVRIAVPSTGAYEGAQWMVQVRLVELDTVDADPIQERRTIVWESVTGTSAKRLGEHEGWRGVPSVQIAGKASEELSGYPTIKMVCDTAIVRVPTAAVYNPTTRTYSGTIWDGDEDLAFTTDPAWQIRGLLEDPLSGLAALSPGAELNRWDALEASKYYSELVPDGKGGFHPRFNMNAYLTQPMPAEELMGYLFGAVNTFGWDTGNGFWRCKVDKDETPVALFTRENIIGDFQYAHTDVDTRWNDITMSFLNEELNYAEDSVWWFDQANIDIHGRRPTQLVAVGATNRQEALRRAVFRGRVALNETKTVSFVTNRQGLLVQPFDMILVADSDLNGPDIVTTGRIVAVSPDRLTVTVRDPLRVETGVAYNLDFVQFNEAAYDPDTEVQPTDPNWTKPTKVASIPLAAGTATGDVTVLTLSTPLPTDVPENVQVSLSTPALPALPVKFRVTDVEPNGEQVTISGLIVDTGKWTAMDNADEAAILAQKSHIVVPPPVGPLTFGYTSWVGDDGIMHNELELSWQRPISLWIKGFRVEYSINGGQKRVLRALTQDTSAFLNDIDNSTYRFWVYTVDRRGMNSLPLTGLYDIDDIIDGGGSVALVYRRSPTAPAPPVETDIGITWHTVKPEYANGLDYGPIWRSELVDGAYTNPKLDDDEYLGFALRPPATGATRDPVTGVVTTTDPWAPRMLVKTASFERVDDPVNYPQTYRNFSNVATAPPEGKLLADAFVFSDDAFFDAGFEIEFVIESTPTGDDEVYVGVGSPHTSPHYNSEPTDYGWYINAIGGDRWVQAVTGAPKVPGVYASSQLTGIVDYDYNVLTRADDVYAEQRFGLVSDGYAVTWLINGEPVRHEISYESATGQFVAAIGSPGTRVRITKLVRREKLADRPFYPWVETFGPIRFITDRIEGYRPFDWDPAFVELNRNEANEVKSELLYGAVSYEFAYDSNLEGLVYGAVCGNQSDAAFGFEDGTLGSLGVKIEGGTYRFGHFQVGEPNNEKFLTAAAPLDSISTPHVFRLSYDGRHYRGMYNGVEKTYRRKTADRHENYCKVVLPDAASAVINAKATSAPLNLEVLTGQFESSLIDEADNTMAGSLVWENPSESTDWVQVLPTPFPIKVDRGTYEVDFILDLNIAWDSGVSFTPSFMLYKAGALSNSSEVYKTGWSEVSVSSVSPGPKSGTWKVTLTVYSVSANTTLNYGLAMRNTSGAIPWHVLLTDSLIYANVRYVSSQTGPVLGP